MKLIGLSGYARAGKDTVGKILCDNYGFERVAFADKLREVALAIDPIVGHWSNGDPVRLSEHIDMYGGWEDAKDVGKETRRLLQVIGTEAGRNILGEDVWVNAAMKDLDENGSYVFTDCRFPNEAKAIHEKHGEVWRVDRETGPTNDHPSETALDKFPFDAHVMNTGTLDDLEHTVRWVLSETRFWQLVEDERTIPDIQGRDVVVALDPAFAHHTCPGPCDCRDGEGRYLSDSPSEKSAGTATVELQLDTTRFYEQLESLKKAIEKTDWVYRYMGELEKFVSEAQMDAAVAKANGSYGVGL